MAQQTVSLKCGHENLFKAPLPAVGDIVWCRHCANWSVVESLTSLWNWKCTSCKVHISYRIETHNPERRARMGAGNHSTKYGHIVNVLRGKDVADTIRPNGGAKLPIRVKDPNTTRLLADIAMDAIRDRKS